MDWGANVGRAILLTPLALKYPDQTVIEWREHKYEAIACAILIPLAYILVLTAMQFTPVSYVAPAREISILIGTLMGTRLLGEGDAPRRLAGAGAMVLGWWRWHRIEINSFKTFKGSNVQMRSEAKSQEP